MKSRNEIEQKLIEKAMKDESFREQLLENPKAVIESEMGMKFPESTVIRVIEEDPQTVYLVVPAMVRIEQNPELLEDDLESVAGGTGGNDQSAGSCLEGGVIINC